MELFINIITNYIVVLPIYLIGYFKLSEDYKIFKDLLIILFMIVTPCMTIAKHVFNIQRNIINTIIIILIMFIISLLLVIIKHIFFRKEGNQK
jgi:predicted permease